MGNTNLYTIINELNLENRTILTGFISDSELLSLYKHCDLLAMPSVYEGFGLPALEALSLNKKVVISHFNAISEIKGDNIFLTKLDIKSIAETITLALNSTPRNLAKISSRWDNIAQKDYRSTTRLISFLIFQSKIIADN